MDQITVVGGGLAGLIAASEVAEAGVPVTLLEARRHLGGRARTVGGPYQANLGPHALYKRTELWRWLKQRDLHRPSAVPSKLARLRFCWRGELRRTLPLPALLGLRHARRPAPVDQDLRSWVTELVGEDAAQVACGVSGPLTFDHDPGRLSAAFVWEKIRSVLLQPIPVARYAVGGWGAVVQRLAAHARSVGVRIETGVRVMSLDDLVARGPVVVALDPAAARRLLDRDSVPGNDTTSRVALLDVGLERRRGDPWIIFDLDEAVFVNRFSAIVPSLAPAGHDLVQACVGLRPGEGLESGIARILRVVDVAFPDWRNRMTYHRRGLVTGATGAVDLPGTTWRDRPPVAHADGVWLAGDWVAAPGHLAEVSCTSAVQAAQSAVAAQRGVATSVRRAS